jgi:hypothetical protein
VACYISSNNERLYAAVESSFGRAAAITADARIPAVKFAAKQRSERSVRRDKTGSRTFVGLPPNTRRLTEYEVKTYLTSWSNTASPPPYGALAEGLLGSPPRLAAAPSIASGSTAQSLKFSESHNLEPGDAVSFGGEMRFVSGIVDATTVTVNAPFTVAPIPGSLSSPTVTYRPAEQIPSISLYDFWSPATAVQRFLCGAAVDEMRLLVNGDFHEFEFSGAARDLVDSASFAAGTAALTSYPEEPAVGGFDYSIVPGHLGQVWLGAIPSRFYTLTNAEVRVSNNVDLRDREFGGGSNGCIAAGQRTVSLSFSLYERDDEATKALYQAARQGSPISVMFQLGQQPGQLCGIYLSAVVPDVPEFDDQEQKLQWRFSDARAQGVNDDEVFLAFG